MSVFTELCGIERSQQRRTLGLKVRNTSDESIADLGVVFEWENEQHQPNPDGSTTVGGGSVLYSTTVSKAPLAPGEERIFYVNERYLEDEMLGRVAALSPERYWLSVLSGEQEIARIGGNLVGGVLDGLEC
jgi:hypothetical protein